MDSSLVDEMLRACRLGDVSSMQLIIESSPAIVNQVDSNLG